MNWHFTPYIIPLLVSTLLTLVLTFYTWRHRATSEAKTFIVLLLAIAEWSLGYALELSSLDLSEKIFWGKVQYLGITVTPVAWFLFALQFAKREKWLTQRNFLLLVIIPVSTFLLIWTNERHGLIWSQTRLELNSAFSTLAVSYGPWFWIHWSFSNLLLISATILLIKNLSTSPHLYRLQTSLMFAAILAPWIGNGIYIFRLGPVPDLDLTPFAFALSGLGFGWNLFHYQFLDIVPVARRTLFDVMSDGMLVFDVQNRIVDLNQAAQRIIGQNSAAVIGKTGLEALRHWPDLIKTSQPTSDVQEEIIIDMDNIQRYFDIQVSPLYDSKQRAITGRLIILRDITERKQVENERINLTKLLHTAAEVSEQINAILDTDLLLRRIVTLLQTRFDLYHVHIYLLDGTSNTLHMRAGSSEIGRILEERAHKISLEFEHSLVAKAARERKIILANDVSLDPDFLPNPLLPETQSEMAVPIIRNDQILGVFDVQDKRTHRFNEGEVDTFSSLSGQIATAVENAHLFEEQTYIQEGPATE